MAPLENLFHLSSYPHPCHPESHWELHLLLTTALAQVHHLRYAWLPKWTQRKGWGSLL